MVGICVFEKNRGIPCTKTSVFVVGMASSPHEPGAGVDNQHPSAWYVQDMIMKTEQSTYGDLKNL